MKERNCSKHNGKCEPTERYGQWGPHRVKIVCCYCEGFIDWGKKLNYYINEGLKKLGWIHGGTE